MNGDTVLTFLVRMRHKPWNPAKPDGQWSTSDLIRACKSGSILINGKIFKPNAALPVDLESVVFFPASKLRRTTFAGVYSKTG